MSLPPALRLAVGTLTVLRTGPVTVDARTARAAMLLAPVAVLPLGLLVTVATAAGAGLGWPPPAVGLVGVAALALGTRALHLDGLADTVDGLGAGWDRQRALEVMRRGDVGPMGVVALVLVVGMQAAGVGTLATDPARAAGVGALVCCSRTALVVACRRGVPAARPSGLGAAVAGTVPGWAAGVAGLASAAVLAGVWTLLGGSWLGGLGTAVAAGAATVLVVARCVGRLGGVTGDVMGAGVEIAFTVLLLGAGARGGWSA